MPAGGEAFHPIFLSGQSRKAICIQKSESRATNSIIGDISRNAFSFRAFYARRARRLTLALYAMPVATFVFSLLFCFPEDTFHLAKDILAVSTMTSNIFLSKQTGYFDTKAIDQPLLHTWSLSVEEQF